MSGHWAKTYITDKHLVDLYERDKGNEVVSNVVDVETSKPVEKNNAIKSLVVEDFFEDDQDWN